MNAPEQSAFEQAYAAHERRVQVQNYRVACVLGIIFMPAGVFLDWFVYDKQVALFFAGRLVSSALLTVVWFLLGTEFGRRRYRALGLVEVSIPILCISWMIALEDGGMSTYYAGLNIVLMGAGIVLRWGLVDSLILLVIALATYVAACIAHPFIDPAAPPLLGEAVGATFFNNLYFLIVTGVFIATGNYFFSRNRFTEFQLRYQLDQNRAQLEENNSRLRELDEAKSRFFANISHELRTPLTLLLAPLESIRQRGADQLDAQVREWLDTMQANGMRLLKLINDLLDLVRLESGQLQLRPETFGVPDFVRGLASAVQKMTDDKRIRLRAAIDPAVGTFWGDRDKLEKVFLNLLFNAIKFTPAGGQITFSVEPVTGAGLQFAVQDTGMGIPPDQLKHVFTRFWQADSSAQRKYQGVGIGLALVKELVEAHQGMVELQSEVGAGTRFTVTLPVLEGQASSAAAVAAEPAANVAPVPVTSAAPPPDEWLSRLYRRAELFPAITSVQETVRPPTDPSPAGRPRLLVADDEPDMLRYLRSHLAEDFQVLEAVDGRQAIELAQQYVPEVCVCDMMMPEVDGLEVCRQLRQRHTTQHIPILLLTARADEETKIAALTAGASDFLTKPFSTVELRVRVRNLYESRRLQRELAWQNKKLEATLEQLKETETQLVQSEKLASLGRMSAGIIHEINNPLNYAKTALHALKSKQRHLPEPERPDFEEIIRDTEEGITRVAQIISDLREFSHPNAIEMGRVEVHGLVESALRFLADAWKNKVQVVNELPEDLIVIGNRHKLVQVFINLLQNACDALATKAFPDGESAALLVRQRQRPGWVIIAIRDNGPGMDRGTIEKAFDPFFTTKDVGKGIGLGLSICYQILAEHGGRIDVTSEVGRFCEFALEFPAESEK